MEEYLASTEYFDFAHEDVKKLTRDLSGDEQDPVRIAVRLYNWVRDEIRYNPYTFCFDAKTLKASHAVHAKENYCIPKAILLGAMARSRGIPSRLGLADVRNHISSPQLIAFLKSDIFVMHGYIELFLEGRWVVATPAFNLALCQKLGLDPLEFDGRQDSQFQAYTADGRRQMEYLVRHGTFSEVPVEKIFQHLADAYPHLAKSMPGVRSFESEVDSKK